jgi:hypothetical protein
VLDKSRSPFSRIDIYMPTIVILGIAIPAVLFMTIMVMLGWGAPVLGGAGVNGVYNSSNAKTYLYESAATKVYFEKMGASYEVLMTPWRNYFRERNSDVKLLTNEAELLDLKSGVLILPSAVALSNAERSAISKFHTKGGSVLATWATGTRAESGEWDGWGFLEKLGAIYVAAVPNESNYRELVLHGESPVSHSHPSGQLVAMAKTGEQLLRFKGEAVAARFMNGDRLSDSAVQNEGAIIYTESPSSGTRSAVFGFSENAWEARPIAVYQLIDDALKWLKHEAVAQKAAWPNGKLSAQVIELEVGPEVVNAKAFVDLVQSNRQPVSCYVLSSVAKTATEAVSGLVKGCELGYMGDVRETLKGLSIKDQQARLSAMKSEMAASLGSTKPLLGFRAPIEEPGVATDRLLHNLGIRHYAVGTKRSGARLPLFAAIPGVEPTEDLVLLPRTQRDDLFFVLQNLPPEQIAKGMIEDFDESMKTGSLGWLSISSQNFESNDSLAQSIPTLLAHVKRHQGTVWVTSAGKVASWWRDRDRFKLDTKYNGMRFDMNVTVKSPGKVDGASVIVMLPRKNYMPTVSGVKVGMSMPKVSLIDSYRALLQFDSLLPGNYGYQVTFAPR